MALAIAAPFFARADVPADLAAHVEAGRAFDALRAARPDTMPRLADADSAAVLRVLGDVPRFLDGTRFAPNELGALSDLCDRDRSAIVAYIAFGALQNGQLAMDVMARNATDYQDEIALLQRFQARCIAKQVPLAEALFRQLGEAQASRLRLGGLQRSQAALLQTYTVATGHCAVEEAGPLGASGYCGVLDTLAELAPVHARALPLASRATVTSLVTPLIARAAPPRKAELQRIADVMAGTRCTGLCLLQPSP
ncbi:MAG: hypothetical protein EOO26_04770 [Comamonadaceae bacterium]|nr:MAG: hypothetical protein EOO26_04770 [Comamonadaceae bacterium]